MRQINKGILLAIFVLLIGFSLTLFVCFRFIYTTQQDRNAHFLQETIDIENSLHNRLNIYKTLLFGARSYFAATNTLNRQNWHTYVTNLEVGNNFPGIASFGYAPMVYEKEKVAFIHEVQQEEYPTFTISPPGTRPFYTPTLYGEPFNPKTLGADGSYDVPRLKLTQNAIQTGLPVMSDKVLLFQDIGKEQVSATVLRIALYKNGMPIDTLAQKQKAVVGFISISFRVRDLFIHALGIEDKETVYAVYDGKSVDAKHLYYQNFTKKPLHETSTVMFTAFDHPWTIVFYFTQPLSFREKYGPAIIIAIGALVSLLLFYLIYLLATDRQRILILAQKMTKDLREDEKKLEEAMNKDEFISVAAHQLRTPLGIQRWTLERLLSQKYGKLLPKVKEQLDDIYANNLKLIKLVADLLDVSRIAQGRVKNNPIPTDLGSIIERTIEEMKGLSSVHKVSIVFTKSKGNIIARVDPELFHVVIQNLLSNAIKYNRENGTVTITLEKVKNKAEMQIIDTGIGVPDKEQERVFEKFQRGSNAAKYVTEGTGLGLFIVKSHIESWKGTVGLTSTLNKGTTITIDLPLKKG